jgi:hypothetical protein
MKLRLLANKPASLMSLEGFTALLQLVADLTAKGTLVVLGDKRYFLCDDLLGERIDTDLMRVGLGEYKVFMKLCNRCFERFGDTK